MLEKLTPDDFRPHLNSEFSISAEGADGPLVVELIEVSDLGPAGRGPRNQPFSLLFRAPLGVALAQQIYAVSHPEMDTVDIFLVPINPDEKGMRLQAIFN